LEYKKGGDKICRDKVKAVFKKLKAQKEEGLSLKTLEVKNIDSETWSKKGDRDKVCVWLYPGG